MVEAHDDHGGDEDEVDERWRAWRSLAGSSTPPADAHANATTAMRATNATTVVVIVDYERRKPNERSRSAVGASSDPSFTGG